MKINKVVVIGSGTMGAGIAAHLCNANIPVTLLDLKTEISEKARDRIFKSKPPLLFDKSKVKNIEIGNINDHFDTVKKADWIVEAVVERIDIKQELYKKIFKIRKKESIVSSNTSTIPLKVLSQNLSKEDKKDFCITHFFNPVRYMDLLEIVKNEFTDKEKINFLKIFCETLLGKGVILCNDTPGFLGNRVGVYAMQVAMTEALKMKLSIEEADSIFARPMGIPKTGVFGLYDLIGIDLMSDVLKSFIKELPKTDEFHLVAQEIPLINKLITTGYTGRKGKGGFYRINKSNGKKILEALNLETGQYSPAKKINIQSDKVDLKKLINRDDQYGKYAWSVLSKIIKYASSLVPEITKEFNDIDEALRLGFNWSKGPFEMLEEIGVKNFFNKIDDFKNNKFLENLSKNKQENFCKTRQKYTNIETFGKVKKVAVKIDKNDSAKIFRFKDFNIVEFITKANALDYNSMDALKKATDKPLIIINEGMQFSAGVNLNYLMDFVKQKDFKSIEKFLKYFQETCKHLKYCENPVISAPSGLTLGGGFEVLVQSDYVITHTNIVLGLVETLVGLIPCGGGCKEMLWRWMQTEEAKKDSDFTPQKVFDIIGYGKTITSPMEAMSFKFLLTKDKSVMNRNELLPISRNLITKIKNEYEPPKSPIFNLSGSQVRDKMFQTLENLFREKKILEHGMEVGKKLAFVLSGGNTSIDKKLSEDDLYALEFEAFVQLLQMEKTQARINHTLKTGKPLVN
ncbi:MAG: enoyl-CoA hydratase/isomerase family protein [Pelagibacteraceae bacterium]|nr:enoyl-CoA hydratase/isomerase family protein [Pelagibacteraceae bacterium]